MTVTAVHERLKNLFVEVLELPEGVEVETLKYRDIPQWDSLGHMSLVAAMEDEFGVQLDTEQVIGMSSFKVALDMLKELGVNG
jgi:acyl carrier protein